MSTIINQSPQTSFRSGLNGAIPGDAATGHLQRSVVEWVENLAPQDTPLLNKIRKGRAYNQAKIEWGQGANLLHTATVSGTLTSGATTLNLGSGEGVRIQQYQTLRLYNLDANSQPDFNDSEIVWVTARSSDALTIVRAQGGTSATQFEDGAKVEILPTAIPEGFDFTKSPTVFGDFYSNYFELIQQGHNITEEANVTPNWEFDSTNHIARLMRAAGMRAKLHLEKQICQGGGQEGTNAAGVERPAMMAGFPEYIPSANKTNLNGLRISPYDIETEGAALWDSVGEAAGKTLIMSMRSCRMFDGLLNRYRQADMNDTSITPMFRSFETRFGTFDIMPTRWVPEGVVFGLNFKNLSIHPYQGMDWTEKEHSTDGAYLWRSIYGKFTLVCLAPDTMFQIYGFDTDLGNYGRVI